MSNPGRPDSATALARSTLFSHLGRLDLARLAGELEEMHFTPGQPIVREGDRPDGFYVIKYGRAAVLAGVGSTGPSTGDGTRAEPLTTLGPGEVFGEMALLTDSPRTATVVAETDLMVWRLSRARFDTLLDHERGIARSIERSLIHRLTTMNHETGALRALSHRLTAAVLGRLTPGAVRLVAGVAVRPRWSAEILRRTCTKTGDGAALAELVDQTGLLRAEGTDLVVDPTFLAIAGAEVREPNPAWLRAAAEELAAAGDVIAATDLALAAGAVEDAEHLLGTHEARLLESASAGDLDRWLAAVGERSPALGSRLGALRTRLADRMAPATQAAGPGSRERAAPLFSRLAREFTTVRALSALAAVIFFVLGWVLPLPEGLERGGLVTLGAIPDYVVMVFLTLALVLPGLVPPADILGGFATPAWNMVFTLLAIGVAVSRSELIVGFASRPYHGIAPAWLALIAFLFLFTLGALDQSAFQGGGTLGLLVYCGVILSLGNVFTTLHIDTWLTSLVQSGMPAMVRNPYGFVVTISIIAFVLHFFVPWMTASTIIALVAMPIAEGLGFHPFIPVLVALIAGDHTILPYVNSGYAMVYFASEGELFTHAQARWPLVLEAILRPVALLLSVPVWQLMGLM